MNIQNSPMQKVVFEKKTIFLKRDDLLHKDFSGNKARKFLYFLEHDFPQIKTLISHGSNQSNAMYSLSVLAQLKKWNFIYYTNHLPSYLKENPQGNYKYALANNMDLIVDENFSKENLTLSENTLFIQEGGALQEAAYGVKTLADEISKYIQINKLENVKIFLPSGTGTTALFLQKYLDYEVLTCPCVGDAKYLQKQFLELERDETKHPTIIPTPKKYHFGKLYKENYEIWGKLKKDLDIEFDLLYDPIGWNTLLENYDTKQSYIYIHQGGIIGNESMVNRYQHKYKF